MTDNDELAEWEPDIIINGRQLTKAQAMVVRVAVSCFDPDCGNDDPGMAISKAYHSRMIEVFMMMLRPPPVPR